MPSEAEKLSENMEDYLEVIYVLSRDKGVARVGEIAEKMEVKSPSVNAALKSLSDRKLVVHEKYGNVALTEAGRKLAISVQEKHEALYRFLTEFLMIQPLRAEKDACSIEHALSEETFLRLVKFFEFLEQTSAVGRPLSLKEFGSYYRSARTAPDSQS